MMLILIWTTGSNTISAKNLEPWAIEHQEWFVMSCSFRMGQDPNVQRMYDSREITDVCSCVKDYFMYNYNLAQFKAKMDNYTPQFGTEIRESTIQCVYALRQKELNQT